MRIFKSKKNKFAKKTSQKGVAILLVVFILALATIIIVNLTYSTMISSQQNANMQRATQAEYLLKSMESLAIVLLKNDLTMNYDGKNCDISELRNPQSCFLEGKEVTQFVQIPIDNISLQMQLVPTNAYLNFSNISSPTNIKRQELILSLFNDLDLENILGEETSTLSKNSNSSASNEELVANLIDYMDTDDENFVPNGKLTAPGIEGSISDKNIKELWKAGNKITNLTTLYNIPGFNMNKVRAIAPYFSLFEGNYSSNLNPNFVDQTILAAISELASAYGGAIDIDGILSKQEEDPPFQSASELQAFISEPTDNAFIANLFGNSVRSDFWELNAKVTIGNTTAFCRSIINKSNPKAPKVISREYLF